jgi:hypothetical protein
MQNNHNDAWGNATRPQSWKIPTTLILQGLKSKTTYDLRVILLENREGYFGEDIAFTTFTTHCAFIGK